MLPLYNEIEQEHKNSFVSTEDEGNKLDSLPVPNWRKGNIVSMLTDHSALNHSGTRASLSGFWRLIGDTFLLNGSEFLVPYKE